MVIDPVCRMQIFPRQAQATTIHRGKLYYFCSPACRDRFLLEPERHATGVPAMRLTVGVMGSASEDFPEAIGAKAFALGQSIAREQFALITGASGPALPVRPGRL